ncbi:hypothetical protein DYB32_000589 [Aphanomyces invadans]|uniref:HSF-type DNA-binding domain-containing protein n=1 Tax=Aphanomyces invadans TaxID=157072 RepID=A0A3R6WTQ7_9STRA|nr:hypothetical protein DYB32_000589 [Aphanomyces invadans]
MISPTTGPRSKKRDVGVPKFLRSLFEMLETEDTQIISWTLDGASVQVLDRHTLESHILPKYFKHSKFTSFQRQLNYFGFKKNTKFRSHMYTFTHPYFRQNRKDLLSKITRHYGHDDDAANGGNAGSGDENDSIGKFLENETPKGDEPPFSLDPMLHLNSQDLDTLMCLMDPETPPHTTIMPDTMPLRIQAPFPSKSLQRFMTLPKTPPCMEFDQHEKHSQLPTKTRPLTPVSPPSNLCFSPLPSQPVYSSSDSRRIESTNAAVRLPPSSDASADHRPHMYSHQPHQALRSLQQPRHAYHAAASQSTSHAPYHSKSSHSTSTPHAMHTQQQHLQTGPNAPRFADDYGVLYEAASMFL